MKILNSSYVRQKGKIFPWGAFRTFHNSVDEDLRDTYAGLWLYNKKLLPYGKGNHYAKILNGELVIFSKPSGHKVAFLQEEDLHPVRSLDVVLVSLYGYLDYLGDYGMRSRTPLLGKRRIKMIHKAEQGIRPPSFDNSEYVKVPEKYIGQKLITIDLGVTEKTQKKTFKIFTFDGEQVTNFTISRPLAFKKWGVEEPSHGSFRNYDLYLTF